MEVVYSYQKRTRLPHLKVDTEPIEFCAAKLLSRRCNRTIHDVQSPFAHCLRGILEVDYEGFRVRDENTGQSKPTMNHAGIVNPFNCVDNIFPEATKL